MLIDEVNEHEHALLRGYSDQLIALLADPEYGDCCEDRKGGESFVAE